MINFLMSKLQYLVQYLCQRVIANTAEFQKKRHDLNVIKLDILERFDKLFKTSQRNAAAELKMSQLLLYNNFNKEMIQLCILTCQKCILTAAKQSDNSQSKRNRDGKD